MTQLTEARTTGPFGTLADVVASGGVLINSWMMLEKPQSSDRLAPARAEAATTGQQWWWN